MNDVYREVWGEIYFILSESIPLAISESVFEQRVIRALERLGWSQFKQEIKAQKSIPIGRQGSIRPDIVVYGPDKNALFAIEIKRPADLLPNIDQLKSYMRQVKAEFGILIGNEIRVFYDGTLNPHPEPIPLEIIKFEKHSSFGKRFVEMFTKSNFLNGSHLSYLDNKVRQFSRNRELKKLKEKICSEETKIRMLDFLKEEFSEISQDIVTEALRNLIIDIYYRGGGLPQSRKIKKKGKKEQGGTYPGENSLYAQICKNKTSEQIFLYIEEAGMEHPQLLSPNGKIFSFDQDRFDYPHDEVEIEELLSSGMINKIQFDKYKSYIKSFKKRPKRLPNQGTPKSLSHTLEVLHEVRIKGLNRLDATNIVAERSGTTRNTIQDQYTRRIGKLTDEIDQLWANSDLTEFRSILEEKFPNHVTVIRNFFESKLSFSQNKFSK